MKKFLKIIGILLLIFIAVLIAIPLVLESKIDTIVQNYADENLNADLSFDDISLSLISSFPKAEVNVENLKIINRAPFEDETLVTAKSISFEMPVRQLFSSEDEPLAVNEIIADELLLTLKTNKNGTVNYDIVKKNESVTPTSDSSSTSFSFDIEHYELNNSAITYLDEESNVKFDATDINHSGNGIFSGQLSELETNTVAKISLSLDSTNYLTNNNLKLDALIDLNLDEDIYTFKENKGFINALPLEFNGFVQLVEAGQQIDITFKNPESSFKDFLAILPETYSKNIEDVTTTGSFKIDGEIKGLISDESIPTLDINLLSKNASFKYPDLAKSVDNITIDASIKNKTGKANDTYIDINKLDFKVDQDVFKSEAHIKNLTGNILIDAYLDGVLNLANITKAYPIELENQLSGILKGKLNTSFDMNAIETNAYQRIKNKGSVTISDFIFSSEDIVNPIQINNADLSFKPGNVMLNSFDAQTGKSDFKATGYINNLLGFLLSDKKLQGDFKVTSNNFVVEDFMVEDESVTDDSKKTTSDDESLKIPDFLDCSIYANAQNVVYDNLTLKNVSGKLRIKDQNANLSEMTTSLFGGKLGINGNVSTKSDRPIFDMQLAMQQFDISQSFNDLEMLKALAPIAKVVQGKLNSTINVSGLLDENFTPDLNTISGDALAEILTSNIDTSKSPILSGLDDQLNFIDFNELEKDIKTKLKFDKGEVTVNPFTITYNDIPIEVSGKHSFTNTMDYKAIVEVPAKYLGNDVNQLLESLNDPELDNVTIPVTANIDGTFSNPNIKTDLTSGIANLTNLLIEIQKQKLLNQGKDKVNELIGGILGNNKNETKTDSTITKTDSTKTNSTEDVVKEGVKNVLGDIFRKKKSKEKEDKKVPDSTKND
ncbi:AsmA-like C-terminal region-containing protein [Winogradskyella vincentii]|uniref:AsmA-like C-terminal region-containing protein n=1 Tax=Winogradskyella vincentii TaxID=2877122 RepID=A0ABS7Y2D4_9FLAO|nr:AsmA-like C-terminal region-containing protein [Winogradskyella vincentii]MCA0154099.1 AsmA-like C-terminal region-containing protein [Winogradskyella vincentii]